MKLKLRLQSKNLCLATALAITGLLAFPVRATELKPETTAGFNQYIRATEARIAKDMHDGHFLVTDGLPGRESHEAYAQLRQGRIYVRRLRSEERDKPIRIPYGLIHHWVGVVFIPGVTLDQTIAELQDYPSQPVKYAPTVRQAKILEHAGNEFKTFRQFYYKQIVTVVINAEFDDVYETLNASQATVRSSSTRLAEVADSDKPTAHELPVGNDHGYIWRLQNYWHIEEKDAGVYAQVESVTLTRTVPLAFAWLVNPLIKSIPRAVISGTLSQTRKAILTRKTP